jgi:hypothetical protein
MLILLCLLSPLGQVCFAQKETVISYFFGVRQRFESSRSTKKRDAQELLDIRKDKAATQPA